MDLSIRSSSTFIGSAAAPDRRACAVPSECGGHAAAGLLRRGHAAAHVTAWPSRGESAAAWPPHSGLLPRGDELVDPLFQDVHRQGAGAEHLVVEGADVELAAELALRLLAQLENLQLPDLVAEGLAGPHDVAVGLVLDVHLVLRRMGVEEIDNLLTVPLLVMQAGVDHQPDRAQHLVLQTPVI